MCYRTRRHERTQTLRLFLTQERLYLLFSMASSLVSMRDYLYLFASARGALNNTCFRKFQQRKMMITVTLVPFI